MKEGWHGERQDNSTTTLSMSFHYRHRMVKKYILELINFVFYDDFYKFEKRDHVCAHPGKNTQVQDKEYFIAGHKGERTAYC